MAYATLARLKEEAGSTAYQNFLPPGMKDAGDTAAIDAYLTRQLNVASAEIDRYLQRGGQRVPVDVTTITDADQQARAADTLAYWCVVLARSHMGGYTRDKKTMALDQEVKAQLELIASGQASIPGLAGAADGPVVAGTCITGGPGFTFKRDHPLMVSAT